MPDRAAGGPGGPGGTVPRQSPNQSGQGKAAPLRPEALIRLSRDPMQGIKPFVDLLNMVSADIAKADNEVAQRVSNKGTGVEEETEDLFQIEKEKLDACRTVIEEVKRDHVNG